MVKETMPEWDGYWGTVRAEHPEDGIVTLVLACRLMPPDPAARGVLAKAVHGSNKAPPRRLSNDTQTSD